MPHIIGHMDNCYDALFGNATTGNGPPLKTAYHALDLLVTSSDDPPAGSHELLEDIQQWLCDGGTYENGAADQAKAYTDASNKYL